MNEESTVLTFFIDYGYYGLFLACFLSATILPLSSDIVFGALVAMGLAPLPCLVVASIGNWLGGMTNYCIGYLGKTEWIQKYLKVKQESIDKIQHWLHKKGALMALFSFMPVVGDLIPLALGFMKANVWVVSICVFVGKFLRYAAILYLVKVGVNVFA
jgi:membrane protein YqaA with SNARE-associated domain